VTVRLFPAPMLGPQSKLTTLPMNDALWKALIAALQAHPARVLDILETILALLKANPELLQAVIALLKKQAA